MDPISQFKKDCTLELNQQGNNPEIERLSLDWIGHPVLHHYSYHFSWLGRPIIQYPQDIVGMQEIIFSVKPDLIIETGIAHGGSLIFYTSLLELNALCGGPENAHVLGIDIDIRQHNRQAIEQHPLFKRNRITLFEGSSIADDMINKVTYFAKDYKNIMVLLDSNHTHDHVFSELNAYADLVTQGSYCVVFDTIVEKMPTNAYPDRPWGKGNNPMTAVNAFLEKNKSFIIDRDIDSKLLISAAPSGFLKKIG